MMAAIETIYFVKTLSQHIGAVVPIPTQDRSTDDSVEITNVLQETEGDDKVQEVISRSSGIDSRKADKEDDSGISCISCFHVLFLRYKIIFLRFIFIVNTGGNQHSFC